MNLIKVLEDEFNNKNLSDIEKLRYIYLFTCKLFSFDSRYYYGTLINKKIAHNIYYKKIDIENIDDFRIICRSYTIYVLKKLIAYFLGLPTKVIYEYGHCYLLCKIDKDKLVLDATVCDLFRVKMNLITKGFYHKKIYEAKKEDIDKYYNDIIKTIDLKFDYNIVDYQFKMDNILMESNNTYEIFLKINELLINSNNNMHFSDANYFVNYLYGQDYYKSEYFLNDKYEFYRLFNFNDEKYLSLDKITGLYQFREIDEDECNYMSNNLKSFNKSKLWRKN